MVGKAIQATAERIAEILRPLSMAERDEVMAAITKWFCRSCWRDLEPGERCFCSWDE
jgi:hypothetical protein